MLNPAPKGNDQQIAVTATEGAALIGLPEKIEFLNFLVDKTESIVLPDVQERLDGEGRYPRQESDQVQAEEDQPKELKRETSFFGAALRFAVVGSAHVEQRSPVPTLTLFGMPASLHQIAVSMPHRETAGIAATRMTNAGLSSP